MAIKKKSTRTDNKDLEQINEHKDYTEIVELLKLLVKNSEEVKIMLEKLKDRFV